MAKFKITGLPKAQGGLIVNDPLDPRLKAYNDSLSLYNRFPMPRDKSHFWPIRTKEESTRLAKDFGTGTRILPVGIDSYDAVLRNGLYYHKPIFKKPKLKVTLEEKKIEDLRLPINPINTADIEAMMSPMPRDIIQAPVRRVPNDSIVPPASKEIWKTLPDGTHYRVERPVDPRLTKKVKIGFYQEGGQLQPGYYKYKHKPEASYKYDGNQWYISNEGTKGNYQPIEDPNGTRSKTLAKGLDYGTTQFYAPLAENVQNQTAFPQVSQKSIQTSQQNLNADLANQKQAVDNLTEYQNRKRNQTDYNVRDLPEEKGWYYNQGETLKGVADESVGDVDSETAAITALSGDAEEATLC